MSHQESTRDIDEVKCPTCGRVDFKSKQGMRYHHAIKHGESLVYAEAECDVCGNSFTRHEYELNRYDATLCSKECVGKFTMQTAETDFGYGNRKGRASFRCLNCGNVITTTPAKARDRLYCSRECYGQSITGADHPNWRGGHKEHYGPGWDRVRELAIRRDGGKCTNCGKTRHEEREGVGMDLVVHHIVPRRHFLAHPNKSLRDANKLPNLLTLCRHCHAEVENSL